MVFWPAIIDGESPLPEQYSPAQIAVHEELRRLVIKGVVDPRDWVEDSIAQSQVGWRIDSDAVPILSCAD